MPNFNNLRPGDIPYDQYTAVFEIPLDANVAAVKGKIMSVNSSGHLIAPPTTSATPNLTQGMFQCLESADADATAGAQTVQVLQVGSRIVLQAPASVTVGDRVGLSATNATTAADSTVVREGNISANYYLGRVMQIATWDSNRREKYVTAANDYIIVALGKI